MKLSKQHSHVLFAFYSVCFLGASFNHGRDILLGGFLPYRDVPLFYNLFWTSLAFVDPVVPLLFFVGRYRYALALAVGIMVLDVSINTCFAYHYRGSVYGGNMDLLAQSAFLFFVLLTAPVAWHALSSHRRESMKPLASRRTSQGSGHPSDSSRPELRQASQDDG